MALPKITQTVQDGGLGLVTSSGSQTVAKVGVCASGTAATVYSFEGPDVAAVKTALGVGPLTEAVAHSLEVAGGPVLAVPVTASVAGVAGTVSHTGTGTSTMTVSGAPKDGFEVQVKITRAGASLTALTAAFEYSLDGGDTFSPEIAVPANGVYVLGASGCTITFAAGTFVANDLYSFDCTAPGFSTSDLGTALDALKASSYKFGCIHVVGAPAPSLSAVTPPGAGTPPAITLTGTPSAFVDAVVKVSTGGALDTVGVEVSTDGGATFGSEQVITVATPAYLIPNTGITLNFAAGTYVLDDEYTFNSYASIASLFSAVDTKLTAMETAYKYTFAVLEAPDTTDAILTKATASSSSSRIMVAAGYCELSSSLSVVGGKTYKRSAAWPITARIAKAPIHEDLGRYRSGSLPGVSSLDRDANSDGTLARFETLRTITDAAGFYITSDSDGNMMAALGSDFAFVQNRRVMDEACAVNRVAMLRYLNDSILVDSKTGYILETEARGIEADVNGQLEADLINGGIQHASAVACTVKRDENILSTKNLTTSVSVTPKSYAKTITTTIGFSNPALQTA